MTRRAVVTGSEGFVGNHFVDRLMREGWWVTTCDIADPNEPWDCRDLFDTDMRFDLSVHCAASIPAVDERRNNKLVVAEDFELDAAYFRWAARVRPDHVVYFSSSAAYPVALQNEEHYLREEEIDLNDLRSPDDMYGLTKLVGEVQAQEARRHGLNVIIVRPQSGYGTDQSVSYPFRAMIERAKRLADPFEVWGTGEQVRDFVHIDDIVGCVLTMIENGNPGPLNIGTGIPTTMLQLAQMITHAAGYSPTIWPILEKPIGTPFRCCDPRWLHKIYVPQITLAEGIRRALA